MAVSYFSGTLISDATTPTTGYYTSYTFYGAGNRLYDYFGTSLTIKEDTQPSYKCQDIKDKHTVSGDSWGGNGKLSKPIGLLTADEVVFAGGTIYPNNINNKNTSYYLYTSNYYWLMSPFYSLSDNVTVFDVDNEGGIGNGIAGLIGLLPVISLKSEVIVESSGTGTYTNPYIVLTD